ncbi:Protein of unknown function DUF3433 [Penicillium griseofulvum]|uniref:Uncharacterized protein n=1 Tax=Penicillium patulum TaxID=5078 RepID=A0A135LET5_PENPA|nr:Protein of unknown function DUF3433 [Penicillium griseofulvum]KXG47473.1 Protein of unknown function DUF3433 [Penicillium griseofulvum]
MAWKTNTGSDKSSFSDKYHIQDQTPRWRPCYLRRGVLLVFAIIFCIIIAALETLNQISQAHNGIASSNKSRHYFWTYGPTAILTIVASFWSRVEFQAKQSAPWYSLLHGPEQAEKNVLLDYISEMQMISIWRALKNKHFIVASGVASSILLRLLVIFSTGLFSLQQVQVQKSNVPIQMHSNFNIENSTLYGFGLQAYDILNGVLFDNLPFPDGSTANFAFQEFSASALPSDANITVPIQGLMADLDCEVADVTVKGWPAGNYSSDLLCRVDLKTPSCNISNVKLQMMSNDVPIGATLQEGQCDNTNGPGGTRVVATSQEAKIVQSKDDDDSKKTLRRSVALICKPSLMSMSLKAQAKASQSSSNARFEPLQSQNATLPGLTAGNLIRPALSGFENTNGFRAIESHRRVVGSFSAQTQVALGMWLTGATPNLEPLFEVDVLQNVTVSYYRAMTAQLLHLARSQHEATTYGQAIVHENRVLVSQVPLRVMEALLSLGVLLLGSMIFFVSPETLAQWNPSYISSIVTILANSEDLRQSLRGTGAASMQDIYSRLAGQYYYSQNTPRGSAILSMSGDYHELDHLNPPSEYVAWKPFPGLVSRASGFVIIAMIIAALEVVLHLSQAGNGIADISFNEYLHYLWTIIPASIMVIISIFYSSMDFNTRCLAPFARLKQSTGATLKHSLGLSFLDNLGLHHIFLAVGSRHFAVLATTLATGAAFFLTIVTSGLYSATDVPRHLGSNFTQNGSFPNPKSIAPAALNIDEFSEVTGIVTAKYILQDNLTFPSWTWDDLVLPEILPHSVLSLGSMENSYVDIQVSALRAAPSCQLQTRAYLNPNITMENNSTDKFRLTVNLPRLSCSNNTAVGNWTQEVFSGKQLQSQNFGYSVHSPCSNPDPMNPGPKLWTNSYIWGQLSNTSVKSITALRCMQYAETIDASIRLKLPGLEITPNHPPIPDESSAKLVPDVYVPMSEWWVLSDRASYPMMDAFFHFLIAGKYGIPIEDLGAADQSEKVINAIKRQIRLITAQQFNYFSRRTSNETISRARLVGNITMPDRLRLVQDATSTRILEGILAAMLVLGILGSVIMNTDHVLPKNPCSIAAVASLLADSDLIDRQALEMMHPKDKPLQSSFFGQCRAYLGWRDGKYTSEPLGVGTETGSRGKFMIYLDSDDESRGWDVSQSETDVRNI